MSRWQNNETGVVVVVDDSKDSRFASGWTAVKAEKPAPKK